MTQQQLDKMYYGNPYVLAVAKYNKIRKLAHQVKEGDQKAIRLAGRLLSLICPKNSIIIPIPSHTGSATYTLEIAKVVASLTNSKIYDLLMSQERPTLYDMKMQGVAPSSVNLGMQFNCDYEPDVQSLYHNNNILLLDNVIDTGETYKQAAEVIKQFLDVMPGLLTLGVSMSNRTRWNVSIYNFPIPVTHGEYAKVWRKMQKRQSAQRCKERQQQQNNMTESILHRILIESINKLLF